METNGLIQAADKIEQFSTDSVQYELYQEHRTSTRIESKDRKIESVTRAQDVGLGIRILRNQKIGFSFTTSSDPAAVDRAIQLAFDVSELMPEDPHLSLQTFDSLSYPTIESFDQAGLDRSIEEKSKLALDLESETLKYDSRIKGVRTASVGETSVEIGMMASDRKPIFYRETLYTSSVYCHSEKDGDTESGGDFDFSNHLSKLDIPAVARRGAAEALELLGAKLPTSMKCPAIFRNSVVADLLGFLCSSFFADQMDKGRSMLANRLGETVFSDLVNIIDDGALRGGLATCTFDAEGSPTQRTAVVNKGTFVQPLYDHYYAKKHDKKSTSNSCRSLKSPPSIGSTNFFLEKGPLSPEKLIGSIDRGVLITGLMGIHTANPVTGDFSLGASGILIDKGKLTQPLRGFAVAGNILKLFNNAAAIGNDLRFFGSTGAPSIQVNELVVSGS